MEMNNNLESDIKIEPIESFQLLYMILRGQVNQVSITANSNNNMIDQCVPIEDPVLNSSSTSSPSCVNDDNVINIQLLYNSNKPTEPEL